nr:GntR family transcriptional regulator [Sphingomonas sp. CDS-1]
MYLQKADLPEIDDDTVSSSDRVVDAIIRGIWSARYVPGQKLIEAGLTDAVGVSRGPVREALKRLAAEGVITLTRHRGAYIRAYGRLDADEMLEVLEVLTCLMARLAAEAANRDQNAKLMRDAYEILGGQGNRHDEDALFIGQRHQFYDTLLAIAGNIQLARLLPTTQIQLLRLQIMPYLTAQDRQAQLDEYAAITKAVLAGEPKTAESAMRRHMRRSRERFARAPDEAFAALV